MIHYLVGAKPRKLDTSRESPRVTRRPANFMTEETTVDATGESAAIEAPDHTPETVEEVEAVETESEVSDETPAETEETESVNEELPDDVDFSDINENFIPQPEQIDKLRIPKEERERLKRVAAIAETSSQALEELGGEIGVKAFTPYAKLLTKASATDEELAEVAHALDEANPHVTAQLATAFSQFMLSHEQFADPLLKNILGENASLQNIRALLALDKEGLVDKDDSWLGGEPSKVFELQRENAELKSQLQAKNIPEPLVSRATQEFESDFGGEVPQALKATFDKVGWDETSDLRKIVTELLISRLKDDPRYKDTKEFLQNTGLYRNGERRVGMADANLHLLKNKAVAQGQELIRLIQSAFRKQSESSRNRIIAEKAQKAAPKEIPPQPVSTENLSFEEKQKRARERYLAART